MRNRKYGCLGMRPEPTSSIRVDIPPMTTSQSSKGPTSRALAVSSVGQVQTGEIPILEQEEQEVLTPVRPSVSGYTTCSEPENERTFCSSQLDLSHAMPMVRVSCENL